MSAVGDNYKPPCQVSDTPDDWFIEDDGKQYPDLPIVSLDDAAAYLQRVDPHGTRSADEIVRVQAELEAKAPRKQRIRRRHAIDKCHTECYLRLQCLDKGLEPDNLMYGIYGGYTAKERREIVRVRDEKRAGHG